MKLNKSNKINIVVDVVGCAIPLIIFQDKYFAFPFIVFLAFSLTLNLRNREMTYISITSAIGAVIFLPHVC
ncbi:hypothetical protein DRP05_03160 [Archaeoglobales archaeon]|nr:MAG: hypothetical protein DRP05_03160 [Archaeoglobales archaeon]